MQNPIFPSGLSVKRAKKLAKELVKSGQAPDHTTALDSISIKELNVPWAYAMVQLRQREVSPNYLITLADIEKVMQDEPLLSHNGFGFDDSYPDYFYKLYAYGKSKAEYLQGFKEDRQKLKQALDECQRCCLYLQHLKKIKTVRYNLGSYGLKHSAERYHRALKMFDQSYVSNGALICAAIHMGFKVIRQDEDSPNAWICASLQSDILIWEKMLNRQGNLLPSAERRLIERVTRNIGLSLETDAS